MDYLREGIHLRSFAQIDPLVAYQNEAFELFSELMNSIWSAFARMVYHVEVEVEVDDPAAVEAFGIGAGSASTRSGNVTYTGGSGAPMGASALAAAAQGAGVAAEYAGEEALPVLPVVEQRVVSDEEQIGRNDPCWCGSGLKYKKCHGA